MKIALVFSLEHEVEFLVPVSNGYVYQHRVGEMGENVKGQGGSKKMMSMSIFKSTNLYALFYFSTEK